MNIIQSGEQVNVRRTIDSGTEEQRNTVVEILKEVKNRGDEALFTFTEQLDNVTLPSLKVSEKEFTEAYQEIDEKMIQTIREAAKNIRDFHKRQVRQSWMNTNEDGTILGQKVTPLDAVGVYVPGGTAAYPSSLMMGVIPAQVAGVKRVVVVSPPLENGSLPAAILVTANELGIEEIYKVGGAQAIGALTYGTASVQSVDKIVGPGNIYVALAKREVFGLVDIDSIAGPSEIAVLADETANPDVIAADLLSQAEHDTRSAAVLVTPSQTLAEKVVEEVQRQLETLPRKDIAAKSMDDNGDIYVVADIEEGIQTINELAPEHLEVIVKEPMNLLGKIRHAGAIFIGPYSSEPVGDYFAGPNHVLPTSGTARFSSPLTVDDYMKTSSVIAYSRQAIEENGSKIAALARLEGLEAHARAVEQRLEEEK